MLKWILSKESRKMWTGYVSVAGSFKRDEVLPCFINNRKFLLPTER
jgi:hypothetical protein